ncbi:MlaD family protein [Nitratireductor basaltis]|uniref:Mammalian cell entry related domain-containing protein n=1 Tax=Nitratireductor basaltis TaxID=472175 RepID=A0A084UAV3_9HYPH|nr:MlaD family protein [Nitratireductor basaltis]KFB10089.1 Mammalian cell entry related domain-containing protein [Nitratireductor basaltis]
METKANYVAVGAFAILALLAAFGFVYWTAAIGERGETSLLRIRIPGSASGLGRGSAVLFNGVKVGDVRRVYLDLTNPQVAVADAEVDRLTPITRSTQADVGLAGLTGQANIELKGGDPTEQNILHLAEQSNEIAEITASPSAVTNLLQTAQSLLTRADSVIGELEGFVKEARGPLSQTVQNIEQFSQALSQNASGIDDFLANVGELSKTIGTVTGQLENTLKAAEDLIVSVDREKVTEIVTNVEQFTDDLAKASDQFETVVTRVDQAVASISTFSTSANQTLSKVDNVLEGIDGDAVSSAVRNFEEASGAVNRASSEIAKVTEKIGGRSEEIDQIIVDASQLASRLNEASVRVDGVLAKVDKMLESGDGEGLVAEARATLQSFRQVADTLNARVGTITDGLSRFSGKGLRDVEALVEDGRRAITRIERAVTDLERNPQRIITGGEGEIKRYDGRARR